MPTGPPSPIVRLHAPPPGRRARRQPAPPAPSVPTPAPLSSSSSSAPQHPPTPPSPRRCPVTAAAEAVHAPPSTTTATTATTASAPPRATAGRAPIASPARLALARHGSALLDLDVPDEGAEADAGAAARHQWLAMLDSVLTGDILRMETQRLFSQSHWTEPDSQYQLWLALRSVYHGHSVFDERFMVETKRKEIDAMLATVTEYMADRDASLATTKAEIEAMLDAIDDFRSLYPTDKAFKADKPQYATQEFQSKMGVLQTWLNLTNEIHVLVRVFSRWMRSDPQTPRANNEQGSTASELATPVVENTAAWNAPTPHTYLATLGPSAQEGGGSGGGGGGGGSAPASGHHARRDRDRDRHDDGDGTTTTTTSRSLPKDHAPGTTAPSAGNVAMLTIPRSSSPSPTETAWASGTAAAEVRTIAPCSLMCPGSDLGAALTTWIQSPSSLTFLESLLRERDPDQPLERRFFVDLPRYLNRIKATVLQHTAEFAVLHLPVDFACISLLGQMSVMLVQEIQSIRLAYSARIREVTMPALEQLIKDFKNTVVLAHKTRQEFIEFVTHKTGWYPHCSLFPMFELNMLRTLDFYFRLLDVALSAEQNRTKESEILDTEWSFCCSLLDVPTPMAGLGVYLAESFTTMIKNRFADLHSLYKQAIRGEAKLDKHIDLIKLRSRHFKMFFALMSEHLRRAVAIPAPPNTATTSLPGPSSGHPDPWELKLLGRLVDRGYRVIAHTPNGCFVLALSGSSLALAESGDARALLTLNHFLCLLPCNATALEVADHVVLIQCPDAPAKYWATPLLHQDTREFLIGRPENAAMERPRLDDPARRCHRVLSEDWLIMSHPAVIVASSAELLAGLSDEFAAIWGPVTSTSALALVTPIVHDLRVERAVTTLESVLVKYAFTLLNGLELVKELYDDTTVETLYTYASDFSHRLSRTTSPAIRRRLVHRLLLFAMEWIQFTCKSHLQHQQGLPNRKTFRWALMALEFTLSISRSPLVSAVMAAGTASTGSGAGGGNDTRPGNGGPPAGGHTRSGSGAHLYAAAGVGDHALSLLSDADFDAMRVQVGQCMSLLISHFESFSPQLTSVELTNLHPRANFFAGTLNKMEAIERARGEQLREARLVGRVLDKKMFECSLASLSSSSSSISIRWQRGRFLGGGTYGSVYMGINLMTGDLLAVKEIRIQDPSNFATLKQMVTEEMRVMEQLSHPNVVQYYGIEVHRDKVYLFMEYVSNGTLSSLVDGSGLDEAVVQHIMYQILYGLQYLHSKKIVHRDIKPDNILMDQNGNVKLVDFGAAKILSNQKTLTAGQSAMSLIGTPNYLAPEVIVGKISGRIGCQDVYAVGCTMYELLIGRAPWSHLDNQWAIIYHAAISAPPIPDNLKISPEGLDFLKQCLRVNPNVRPTAEELLQHPFLADVAKKMQACDVETNSGRPPTLRSLAPVGKGGSAHGGDRPVVPCESGGGGGGHHLNNGGGELRIPQMSMAAEGGAGVPEGRQPVEVEMG
ncbi:Suppressor of Sensor Kinase (SLN1) [Allomyces arbusculus]|nr:Suppressor of Sensor Kinase (SLN1) [Allomyces arbusculus]